MNSKKWNKITLSSILITLIAIVSFNYIVDPYFIFNTPQISGFNKIKNNSISEQMTKFYTAKRSNPNILLIGTSRTEHINPKYLQKYIDGKIYNLSLPGSGIDVQKDNIKYFIEHKRIKAIIIGLDFFSYNPNNKKTYQDTKNTRYEGYYNNDYLDALLSIKTFRKSIKTIKDNIKSKYPARDYTNGWSTFHKDYIKIDEQGIKYIKNNVKSQLKRYSSESYNFNYPPFKIPNSINQSLKKLQDISILCKKNNVKLYMFISPVYSEITDLIYSRGYGKTYDYWKKELAKYNTIYDFSGYNTITTNISNYIDGSHYQTKLAPLIFAKIFHDKSVKVPNDFGIIINKNNIQNIISMQYRRAFSK